MSKSPFVKRNPFGYWYPAGAENDPNAPYNQEPMPEHCPICGGENTDENGDWLYCEEPFCSHECYKRYVIMEEEKNGAREY